MADRLTALAAAVAALAAAGKSKSADAKLAKAVEKLAKVEHPLPLAAGVGETARAGAMQPPQPARLVGKEGPGATAVAAGSVATVVPAGSTEQSNADVPTGAIAELLVGAPHPLAWGSTLCIFFFGV